MAEILLSLTIIGVVAAITLPSLTGNINERTWNTQRKALYARFSQAIALMPALNGFGVYEEGDPNNVAETFVTSGLAKVLKINNVCAHDKLADCGIPNKVVAQDGGIAFSAFPQTLVGFNSMFENDSSSSGPRFVNTNAAAFETVNGESVVVYYNSICSPKVEVSSEQNIQNSMCANFVYDLNGSKGPNTVGKDIGFISVLYSSDPIVVAPVLSMSNVGVSPTGNWESARSYCQSVDNESRMANLEEMYATVYNKMILGIEHAGGRWTSTLVERNGTIYGTYVSFTSGKVVLTSRNNESIGYSCVKR